MLDDKNTICIDMRNHYESEIGFFKGAIKPDVDTFRESLEVIDRELEKNGKEKNYLMYCTGGIRCEKASAYLKHKGIKNVFQLEGGIIEYTRQVNENNLKNNFLGKNFVFDERRGERISDDIVSNCHQCGKPCDSHINCINESCHLLFIQCEDCREKMNSCCSNECMEIIKLSYDEQKSLRKGKHNSNKIFKKGRSPKLKFKIN
jgi:Predicted sulfurtransferase